ncbi:hypothetical protein EJB05_05919 [Eragrostis curvula]|uniref:Uncharacterized protein n=1 Tax=Eragrostis curvula TaxID=38414 RepID=A0A5J9WET2_9POAL|nr:hypothetical protein EJB05_05919 [Eragrostis curvula]
MAMTPPSSRSSVNPFGAQRNVMAWPRIDMGDADAVLEELCRRRDVDDPENFHDFELDELKELGREVFDLALEDALEFQDIREFMEGWLEQRRSSGGAASEENGDIESAEGGTPMTKKIKLFDE